MFPTLNHDIEQAKADGASSARWDFGHVGSDVTCSLMEQASGNGREIPSRRAMERAIAEYFGPAMVAEVMERHASEGECVDTDVSRAYALAYVAAYAESVRADFAEVRSRIIIRVWRNRNACGCRHAFGCSECVPS